MLRKILSIVTAVAILATMFSFSFAEDIENTGILEILDQRKVVTRNEDSRDTFSMIIEM